MSSDTLRTSLGSPRGQAGRNPVSMKPARLAGVGGKWQGRARLRLARDGPIAPDVLHAVHGTGGIGHAASGADRPHARRMACCRADRIDTRCGRSGQGQRSRSRRPGRDNRRALEQFRAAFHRTRMLVPRARRKRARGRSLRHGRGARGPHRSRQRHDRTRGDDRARQPPAGLVGRAAMARQWAWPSQHFRRAPAGHAERPAVAAPRGPRRGLFRPTRDRLFAARFLPQREGRLHLRRAARTRGREVVPHRHAALSRRGERARHPDPRLLALADRARYARHPPRAGHRELEPVRLSDQCRTGAGRPAGRPPGRARGGARQPQPDRARARRGGLADDGPGAAQDRRALSCCAALQGGQWRPARPRDGTARLVRAPSADDRRARPRRGDARPAGVRRSHRGQFPHVRDL